MRNFILCLFAAGSLAEGWPDYNNQLTNAEWMTGSCKTGREQSPINFKMVTPVEVIEGDDPSENNGLNFSKEAEAWIKDKEDIYLFRKDGTLIHRAKPSYDRQTNRA